MDQSQKSWKPFGKNTNVVYGVSIAIIAVVLAIVVMDLADAGLFELPDGMN